MSTNYRRMTLKHLKSELYVARKLKLLAEDDNLPSLEYLRGYVRGLEVAIESFKYYAKLVGVDTLDDKSS